MLLACIHNAGRSQLTQAFFDRGATADVVADPASTQPARHIRPTVVKTMREVNSPPEHGHRPGPDPAMGTGEVSRPPPADLPAANVGSGLGCAG